MAFDPGLELVEQGVVDEGAAREGAQLFGGEGHAQAQAGGATAVLHRLPHVGVDDALDRAALGDERVEEAATGRLGLALGRGHDAEPPRGQRQELAVEGVRAHGHVDRQLVFAHEAQHGRGAEALAQLGEEGVRVLEGALVGEKEGALADAEHVRVKAARVDAGGVLAGEGEALVGQPQEARDGAGCLARLARRVARGPLRGLVALGAAPAEDVHGAALGLEAGVVGGPLVAERGAAGQGRVHDEVARVGEEAAQDALGEGGLEAAVGGSGEVRDDEVGAPVERVARGRDGGGVGDPHRRGARSEAQQPAALDRRGAREHLFVAAGEAPGAQGGERGAIVRRHDALRHAEPVHEAHLGEALERGVARPRDQPPVPIARGVARRQAGVVVGRPDEAIELQLSEGGSAHPLSIPVPLASAKPRTCESGGEQEGMRAVIMTQRPATGRGCRTGAAPC